MGDSLEHAREGIERAGRPGAAEEAAADRWVAVLVALLAAALAMAEVGEKASQTLFLMDHITMTDDYAYYQAKNLRVTTLQATNGILASLPDAATPAVTARIKAAEATIAQLRDDPKAGNGMKQLLAQAEQHRHKAERSLEREHGFAGAAGALQIAILLASVSIVTRMPALRRAAGAIGALAIAGGLAVWFGLLA
ncbi:MAG: DUF4337 family protein [Rhodospirillales bacterium]|nr:DUF4337 family protein [Rhodospirillales bacterium]